MIRLYTKAAATPLCIIPQLNNRIVLYLEKYCGVRTLGQLDAFSAVAPRFGQPYGIRNIGLKRGLIMKSVLHDYQANPSAFELDVADCLVKIIQAVVLPRRLGIVLRKLHGRKIAEIAREEGVSSSCIDLQVKMFRTTVLPRVEVLLGCMRDAGMEVTECAVKDLFEDRDMALLVWDVVSWSQRKKSPALRAR